MRLAWRLALRDLRAGGRGLWLLALCLFLGTAALAGIGSLASSILAALDDQGRTVLGGDLQMRVSQRGQRSRKPPRSTRSARPPRRSRSAAWPRRTAGRLR